MGNEKGIFQRSGIIEVLKAGALYFALVFGAGFVLAPLRLFWAAPRFGTRTAELMEMPVMLVAVFFCGEVCRQASFRAV